MNFKADWSFLEKISMGAVSSREVIRQLNACGHKVIELERYSTSNKIWTTKIKRLRLPDLICLNCGRRIESRAKSKLDVRMSDNDNNPNRSWDVGLADKDIIAFIQCSKDDSGWQPASSVNYFETKSLRETVDLSNLGKPKSAGEGAEKDRVWSTCIPRKDGEISEIIKLKDKVQIKVKYDDGSRPYTYSFKNEKKYNIYVNKGDHFDANATMIAGVPTKKTSMNMCSATYDFLKDLKSELKENRYAGVKALGYLGKTEERINELKKLLIIEEDHRIKLEIYSSLIRLGEDLWEDFKNYALTITDPIYRFEYVLILGELGEFDNATEKLCEIALNERLDSELRSAAAWGINVTARSISKLIEISSVSDDSVAAHAITNIINNINNSWIDVLLECIHNDETGCIALKVLTTANSISAKSVEQAYKKNTGDDLKKKWCALTIGLMGPKEFDKKEIEKTAPEFYDTITNLWQYSVSAVNDYRSGQIDFLIKQSF